MTERNSAHLKKYWAGKTKEERSKTMSALAKKRHASMTLPERRRHMSEVVNARWKKYYADKQARLEKENTG